MKLSFAAALAALTLVSACSGETSGALAPVKTTPAALLAHVDSLRNDVYVGGDKAGSAADIAGVFAALPAGVSATWDELTFDEASRATVLSNVRITPEGMPEVGVAIASAKLWGFDAEFAKARLSGQRLDETARLAERIDLAGVSAFGIETLIAQPMQAYNDALISTVEGRVDDVVSAQIEAAQPEIENYSIGVDRIIAHDLHLRPWELTPANLPADNEWAEILPVLQQFTAAYRTFAVDTIAWYDMEVAGTVTQNGAADSLAANIELSASRGIRGLDSDLGVMRNMRMSMGMPLPQMPVFDDAGELIAPSTPPSVMQMAYAVAGSQSAGVRLDKAASYLARGQMPPRTETDLLSMGETSFENMSIEVGGQRFYSIASFRMKADDFHWLIPAALRLDVKDYTLDVAGWSSFVAEATRMGGPATADSIDMASILARLIPVLERHGFAQLSSDYSMGWDWNPQSGRIKADYSSSDPELVSIAIAVDGDLPSFDAVSVLIPANPTAEDEKAVQELFARVSALRSARAELVDRGGVEKAFALASDLLKAFRDDLPPEMLTFANMTPQALRQMAVSGAYMAADMAGQQEPVTRDLLRPLAAWLDKGGRVEWSMAPKTPVTAASMQSAPDNAAAVVDRLGLKAVHTPAK